MVTTEATVAWKQAGIPLRFQSAMTRDDVIMECLDKADPRDATRNWSRSFREGRVLESEDPRLCGRGLYLVGKFAADFIGAATMQALILEGHARTGLYINVTDLLEAESPDGEPLLDRRWVDLMLINGVGTHHTTASNWSNSVLNGLIRRRFDRGLPTIITSPVGPQDSGLVSGLFDQAFITVLFKE